MNDYQPQGESAPKLHRGFESYEIRLKSILITFMTLGLIAVVIHIGLGFVMGEFAALHRREQSRAPAILTENRGQFPSPSLQQNPAADMARLRRHEDHQLNTYGWIDRQNRIVHIPIERAMRQVVANGLPARRADGKTSRSSEQP